MRVVVVEDNPDVAELARRQLDLAGHAVVVLPGGTAALAYDAWHRADVAVIDLRMPTIDGSHVLAYLAVHEPHVRCVVLSADVIAAHDLHVRCVAKPWTVEELLEATE